MNFNFTKSRQNRNQQDDDSKYFDEEDDNQNEKESNSKQNQEQEQQEDPLDAYMKQIQENPGQLNSQVPKFEKIYQTDPVDQYLSHIKKDVLKKQKFKQREQQFNALDGDQSKSEESQQCINSEGQIDFQLLKKKKKKQVQLLDPFDFADVKLKDFEKNFYEQHQDITALSDAQVKALRKQWGMNVSGQAILKPVVSFGQLGFSQELIDLIALNQFQRPTPIQCQVLPICLSGRDIVGVAKTGSGKTLAYIWPLLIHILAQEELSKGDGPIGLILAPTRQLCQQIYMEVKKYCKKFNIKAGCILGGQNKHEQWKILKAGVDILIASPGRLIQMIKKKATNLLRVTYLVIDEADKMFSYGFEQQLKCILGQIRQDRQTSLFTATMRSKVQSLVYDYLNYPAIVKIGSQNQANQDIQQQIVTFQNQELKFTWLLNNLHYHASKGKILIFVNQIKSCQKISQFLKQKMDLESLVLHGDKSQYERTNIINSFKTKSQMNILIGTDVASRGLDVREIKTVINYEVPKDIDTYIHRIGRTGRAGDEGLAITLLLSSEHKFSALLIKVFQTSNLPIPQCLQRVAGTDQRYKSKRLSTKMGLSFAKGKDATKLLNRVLQRQKVPYSKGGIGYQQPDPVMSRQKQRELLLRKAYPQYNIDQGQIEQSNKNKYQSSNVQQQEREEKFGRFAGGYNLSQGDKNKKITVTYNKKKDDK